uniref:Uncharacterized protein n=1 Tax=Tetradesmus obliquus TaxID=3088 RepID=A0A383VLB3_TETOB
MVANGLGSQPGGFNGDWEACCEAAMWDVPCGELVASHYATMRQVVRCKRLLQGERWHQQLCCLHSSRHVCNIWLCVWGLCIWELSVEVSHMVASGLGSPPAGLNGDWEACCEAAMWDVPWGELVASHY